MTESGFDSFLPGFDSVTDYNTFPFSSQSIGLSSAEHSQPSHAHTSIRPTDKPSRPRTSLWTPQDSAPCIPGGAGSSGSRDPSSKPGIQSTADQTSTVFESQGVHGQDPLVFPDGRNGYIDFGAVNTGPTPPSSPFMAAKDASSNASIASALDLPSTCDTEHSSSGYSSGLSDLRFSGPQSGVRFSRRQDPGKGIQTCSERRWTCMTSALEILQMLHIPPTACLFSVDTTSTSVVNRQPRKTDSVLSTNRNVLRLVGNMLECPCLSSSQIQLVLSIICIKLIAWYRAIIRSKPDDHQNACINTDQLDFTQSGGQDATTGMANERVLHQPFSVGGYAFDTDLGTKIRTQLVLSELQQLEALIANFSGRVQEGKSIENNRADLGFTRERSQDAPQTYSSGLSSAVHASLIAYLQKQLQDAKAESIAIARDNRAPSAPTVETLGRSMHR